MQEKPSVERLLTKIEGLAFLCPRRRRGETPTLFADRRVGAESAHNLFSLRDVL
jgi:hypothetical protein